MVSKEFYSVKEVAQILGLSRDRIYEYLRTGHLFGTRISKSSAWRIPAAEIHRLQGPGAGKPRIGVETKHSKWNNVLDLALELRSSLSKIGPRDWVIWGLPGTGKPPFTSEAGLEIWLEQGKLMVRLVAEQDKRFPLLIDRLSNSFSEFSRYNLWRQLLDEFVVLCWNVAHEILGRAEKETGLNLAVIPVMGKGHLLNVPKFTYEFALDNYSSGTEPDLLIVEHVAHRHKLVPNHQPDYILAVGSNKEMQRCKEVTTSLAKQYARDDRVGAIDSEAQTVKKETAPLHAALSKLISEATGQS